jgi:hypothetical protein
MRAWLAPLAATAAAGGRRELGNVGLVVGGRILVGRRAATVLQESHAAQAGLVLLLVAALPRLAALTGFAALARLATLAMIGVAVAVGLLLRVALLALLRRIALLLAFLAALAPTLVVALDEAAHALDHAEVVVGVLPLGLRRDAVARRGRFARQRLVLVEHLMGVATHSHIRSA